MILYLPPKRIENLGGKQDSYIRKSLIISKKVLVPGPRISDTDENWKPFCLFPVGLAEGRQSESINDKGV